MTPLFADMDRPTSTPKRPRDPVWDALTAEFGHPATRSERSRFNDAAKQLRDAGADPRDIPIRGAKYRRRYPRAAYTPHALVSHWGQLAARRGGSNEARLQSVRAEAERWVEVLAGSVQPRVLAEAQAWLARQDAAELESPMVSAAASRLREAIQNAGATT